MRRNDSLRPDHRDRDTITEVRKRYFECWNAYIPWWVSWVYNYEYIRGRQYVVVNAANLRVVSRIAEDPNMPQIVINKLKPMVESAIAKLVPTDFLPETQWSGLSGDAKRKAAGQDFLLGETSRRVKLTQLLRKCARDIIATERAIIKTSWQPAQNENVAREGTYNLNDIDAWGGYIHCYSVHPLRFLPAPWSSDNDMPWCIEVHSLHKEQMQRMFPAEAEPWAGAEKATQIHVGIAGIPTDVDRIPAYLQDVYIVYEMYELPTKRHPKGRHVKCTSNKVLYDSAKDKAFPGLVEYPYTFVYVGDGENGLMSDGIVYDCRMPQDEYNDIVSQAVKGLKDALGAPDVFEGEVPQPESWNGGKCIRVQQGSKLPQKMQRPPLPPETFSIMGLMGEAVNGTFAMNDASLGKAPKGEASGRSIELLSALDEQKLLRSADAIQQLASGVWRRMLVEYKSNVTNPEIPLRYVDKSVRFDVDDFFVADITNDTVNVKPIPGYLKSPAAFRQQMLQAVQLGIVTDPEEKREALGLPSAGNIHDEEMFHATMENKQMVRGVPVGVLWYEPHDLHIRVHRMWLLSDEAAQLSNDPQGQYAVARVQSHMEAHARAMMQGQAGAMPPVEQEQETEGGGETDEGMVNPAVQYAPPGMTTTDDSGVSTEEMPYRSELQ